MLLCVGIPSMLQLLPCTSANHHPTEQIGRVLRHLSRYIHGTVITDMITAGATYPRWSVHLWQQNKLD